jgi:hypothetical protein
MGARPDGKPLNINANGLGGTLARALQPVKTLDPAGHACRKGGGLALWAYGRMASDLRDGGGAGLARRGAGRAGL